MLLVGVIKQLVGDCIPDTSGSSFEDFSSSPDASRRSSDFSGLIFEAFGRCPDVVRVD